MLMTGILLAQPGHGKQRDDYRNNGYNRNSHDRKMIVVKPQQSKLVFSFNVDPYNSNRNYRRQNDYNYRLYRNKSNDERTYPRGADRNYRFKDLELVRQRDVEPIVDKLNGFYRRGLINKKDYYYAKQELHEMIGKLYPEDYAKRVIDQIADLHRLRRRGIISSHEYARYKVEILKML